ncbi:hypothetical protein BJP06_09540 [Corynebacterium sp. NML120713]|nr:hypothetical protein BJP06_09540 [Corynebacterium sp. NML120713]
MFPAPAGMSPHDHVQSLWLRSVPRACGDEPINLALKKVTLSVPRACGDEPSTSFCAIRCSKCSPRLRG